MASEKRGDAVAASAIGDPPALFTRTSSLPYSFTTFAIQVCICSTSRTSHFINRAFLPSISGNFSGVDLPHMITSELLDKNALLIPLPTPREPPVTKTTWFGGVVIPSERRGPDGTGLMMVNPSMPPNPVRLVASGTHRGEKDELFAQKLGNYDLVRMGSSLKACIVAEGSADLYPRFGPTSCWDIAAAHAVVSGAGGIVVDPSGKNRVPNPLHSLFLNSPL